MALVLNYENALVVEIIPALKKNLEVTPTFGIEFAWLVKEMGNKFEKKIDEEGGLFDLYCNIKSVLLRHGIYAVIGLAKSDYSIVLNIYEEPEPPRKITEEDCLDDFLISIVLGKDRWERMSKQPKL